MTRVQLVDETNDEEFVRCLLVVIRREFGREGLDRFARIYCSNYTDYTRDRHLWLSGLTLQDIIDDMRALGHEVDPPDPEAASPP